MFGRRVANDYNARLSMKELRSAFEVTSTRVIASHRHNLITLSITALTRGTT
jgi:hypothetical protein